MDAKGYQTARVASLRSEGGTKDAVEVRDAGRGLKGRVSDAKTGRPSERDRDVGDPRGPAAAAGCSGGAARLGGLDAETTSRRTPRARSPSRRRRRPHQVTAKSPDYAEGEVADVKETGGTVEVKLTSGGSVGGVVVAGNQPVPGAACVARGRGRRASAGSSGAARRLRRTETGRSFDHLGAGASASAGMSRKSSNLSEVVLQGGESRNDVVLALGRSSIRAS